LSQPSLHSPTDYFTLLHSTELHSAGLGSTLYSLGADPTENAPEKLPSDACSFSRSLHSNGTTRYSTIFWAITPCSPLKVNPHFGETSPPSSGSKNKSSKIPD
jgi:hypothetical protein